MSGLRQWSGYRNRLGPPLFGQHYLRIELKEGQSLPDYVRVCILYTFDNL